MFLVLVAPPVDSTPVLLEQCLRPGHTSCLICASPPPLSLPAGKRRRATVFDSHAAASSHDGALLCWSGSGDPREVQGLCVEVEAWGLRRGGNKQEI